MSNKIKKITDSKIEAKPVETTPLEEAGKLSADIDSMIDKRDEKVKGAIEHLAENLRITAEKYMTANGVMAALETLRQVVGSDPTYQHDVLLDMSCKLAKEVAAVALAMAAKAENACVQELDGFCDEYYVKDFASTEATVESTARQLLILSLCQNVGPNAQDIKDFYTTANEEIQKSYKELEEFCSEHDIDLAQLSD